MVDKISNARKKELEQPDPFLESIYRGMETARKYKKQLIWLSCAIVAVFVISYGAVYSIRSSEKKASMLLSEALTKYATFEDAKKGYADVKDDFLILLDEYPNTSAGRIASVRFAQVCYEAAEYDQAFDMYKKSLHYFKDDPVMKNLLLTSLGHTCQALKKNEEAQHYFKTIADGKSKLSKDEALFNLGMLAMESGNRDQGVQFLSRVVSEYADSMYKPMAETLIAKQ